MRTDEYDDDAPVDVFEQTAESLVAQIRAMIAHRARYEPVKASDFPERDASFYQAVDRELAAVGFQTLGDFRDAAVVITDPSKKSFVRFALGAHGAIGAMWFEVPNPEGDALQCLVLHSWLADGSVLVTARGIIDSGLPTPPTIVVEQIDGAVDTQSALRVHGERVVNTRQVPCRVTGAHELFSRHASDELAIAEFRERQGLDLFEPMLRAMLGPGYDDQGEPILDAIQRHPEWMTGNGA